MTGEAMLRAELNEADGVQNYASQERDIAVIGMAGRFADALDVEQYWQRLWEGRDSVRAFPAGRRADVEAYLRCVGIDPARKGVAFRSGGWLERVDTFDHEFFSISPKEAKLMSPDQRLLLETVYSAIEDSAQAGALITGSNTGLYVGWAGIQDYSSVFELADPSTPEFLATSNSGSIMVGRVAYCLDLRGPALVVDTACSSSLMAVHLACQALRSGECDQAVAAGVRLYFVPTQGQLEPGVGLRLISGIESPEGRCKSFDRSANGAGVGEGVGAVVLKPLNQALLAGDPIRAVIRGSAANQDGRSIGRSAPSAQAQMQLLNSAWRDAGVDPREISYIEAHGTGTQLGDPVELKGIQLAFDQHTARRQFCGIGSVKPNIGHLDAAAGIAGFIKAVLALEHKRLPPSIHFSNPNAKVAFETSPVYVVDQAREWSSEGPRRCGVSAFGMSGTNCHVVLEELPRDASAAADDGQEPTLLTLSAAHPTGLRELAERYVHWLSSRPEVSVRDFCHTLCLGRAHLSWRIAGVVSDRASLMALLTRIAAPDCELSTLTGVYAGTGKPYAVEGMTAADWAALANPRQRARGLQKACAVYVAGGELNWVSVLGEETPVRLAVPGYPFRAKRCWAEHGIATESSEEQAQAGPLLDRLVLETPELNVYEAHFGARAHWLLREHKIAGFGVVPGVALLDVALSAVGTLRADPFPLRLRATFLTPCVVPEGQSRRVQLSLRALGGQRGGAHAHGFVAASRDEAGAWVQHVDGEITALPEATPLRVDLGALQARFLQSGRDIPIAELQKGRVALGPHWDNYKQVHQCGDEYLIRLSLADALQEPDAYVLQPALMDNALNVLGQLLGSKLYLPLSVGQLELYERLPNAFYVHVRKLSAEQFDREAITYDLSLIADTGQLVAEVKDYTIKKVNDVGHRFSALGQTAARCHELVFERQPATSNVARDPRGAGGVLVIAPVSPRWQQLAAALGGDLVQAQDSAAVQAALRALPTDLVYVQHAPQSVSPSSASTEAHAASDDLQTLMALAKALGTEHRGRVRLHVLAHEVHPVTGKEASLTPAGAMLFAFCRSLQAENPAVTVRCIDAERASPTALLQAEIAAATGPDLVALRDADRYTQRLVVLPPPERDVSVRDAGVYLISGGLAGIGLEIAGAFAAAAKVRLALVSRSGDEHLAASLRATGAEVAIYRGDVSRAEDVSRIVRDVRQRWGKLDGVVHCAGVAGQGYVHGKDASQLRSVLAPKLNGVLNLERELAGDALQFFVVFSSLAAYLGIAGQSDYAAANAFLDAWANKRAHAGLPGLAIAWPAWSETGMAFRHGVLGQSFVFQALTNAEGVAAFWRCLACNSGHVLVGRIDPAWTAQGAAQSAAASREFEVVLPQSLAAMVNAGRPRARPPAQRDVKAVGIQASDRASIEQRLVSVWGKLLDLDEIDVNQNFHSLGGDSLLVTKLYREIDQLWPGRVHISDIFTSATIAEMAKRLHAELHPTPVTAPALDGDLDAILDQLATGSLSVDDADAKVRAIKVGT